MVVYAVDDSGVARVVFEDFTSYDFAEQPGNATDPHEDGTLVQRFG